MSDHTIQKSDYKKIMKINNLLISKLSDNLILVILDHLIEETKFYIIQTHGITNRDWIFYKAFTDKKECMDYAFKHNNHNEIFNYQDTGGIFVSSQYEKTLLFTFDEYGETIEEKCGCITSKGPRNRRYCQQHNGIIDVDEGYDNEEDYHHHYLNNH